MTFQVFGTKIHLESIFSNFLMLFSPFCNLFDHFWRHSKFYLKPPTLWTSRGLDSKNGLFRREVVSLVDDNIQKFGVLPERLWKRLGICEGCECLARKFAQQMNGQN
jgi:hypothetical protein